MIPLRIAAAAAAFGVSAACGTQAVTSQPAPPKLRLSAATAPRTGGPAQAVSPGSGIQPGEPGAAGSARLEIPATLQAAGPSRDAVRQLPAGPAQVSELRVLAAALHLAGTPRRSAGGWRVTGTGTLQVSAGPGLRWSYTGPAAQPCRGPLKWYATAGRDAPAPARIRLTAWTCPQAGPLSGPGRAPGTTSGPSSGPIAGPSAGSGPPTPRTAESAAAPVLCAAGVTSPARVSVAGSVTSVQADVTVQGLPTAGFSTVVEVGRSGAVTAASGWLSRPVPGAAYPLVSARQAAWRQRAAGSRPRDGRNPPVLRVTGARYGLVLRYDGTGTAARPVLVPAWLLQVAGSAAPVPAVAVSPGYLAAG